MQIIVAVNNDWGIGCDGTQQFIIPEDRTRFREMTTGGIVIVGRRTLLDFPNGAPLPGRTNIVLSRSSDFKLISPIITARSLDDLFTILDRFPESDPYVIGGADIYKQLLPYSYRAFVTKIHADPVSDSFFPNLHDLPNWSLTHKGELRISNCLEYSFDIYENNNVTRRV